MKKYLFTLFLTLLPLISSAQKVLTRSGDYTYYAQTSESLDDAQAKALELAKIQIIADEFGTTVGVTNTTIRQSNNSGSSTSYISVGESEVKGEWIETISVRYDNPYYEKGILVVTVHVKGTIRKIDSVKTQLSVKILRNGVNDQNESYMFKDGDDFYVSFLSPESGYVVIYLDDHTGVFRLLPDSDSRDGAFKVDADEHYLFFADGVLSYSDANRMNPRDIHCIYALTCNKELESNRIYVVFSPNKFSRAVDSKSKDRTDTPAELSPIAFQEWLEHARKQDYDMVVVHPDIMIRK